MIVEKLVIENFAGLKHIEIELKKINILIGPQASGKSVIAKILFYCKGLIDDIFTQGINLKDKRQLDREIKYKFEKYFPLRSLGNEDFLIRYCIGEEYIEIKAVSTHSMRKVLIDYSNFYKNSFYAIEKIAKKIRTNMDEISEFEISNKMLSRMNMIVESKKIFLDEISKKMGQECSFDQLFIPAGRSFFAYLQNSIFSLISENSNIDPFLVEFGEYYENAKNFVRVKNRTEDSSEFFKIDIDSIDSIKNRVLLGTYTRVDDQDYLAMNDGREVQLSNCSSGQQEALPLIVILESILFFNRGFTGQSVYIEEPEAHLFPTSQKDIVDLIATVYNFRKERMQFFITTHSPYILTSFNNLLQAGILAEDDPNNVNQITKIIPKNRFLNGDDIAVYSLSDGTCHNIIDSETGLIDAEIIDSVSEDLAVQFDRLLEIE